MQSPTERSRINAEFDVVDERGLILEEVTCKWLLAGMNCWVDMSLFRSDPSYAARCLKLAEASNSLELRKSAFALEAKNGITGS